MNKKPAKHKLNNRWYDAEEMRWAVRAWATRIGVRVTRVQLRPMKSKWASMSTTGNLNLSTDLIDLPKDLGEFVIVHELVHLLSHGHGKVFKSFMHAYMPDWEEKEKQLMSQGRAVEKRINP